MKPVLVGVVGGAGSGKKQFSALLANRLRRRAIDAVEVECKPSVTGVLPKNVPPTADCVLFHGLTLLEDTALRRQLHVKVFLDIDADIRIANMIEKKSPCPYTDIVRAHNFHVEHVMKQRKLADVWVEEVTQEKVDQLVELILSVRRGIEPKEPAEVEVYLEKYEKPLDTPVPGDFL